MTYLDDPSPLLSIHEWMYFCPCAHYTWDQNVNAVLLLLFYVGLFLTIYYRNGTYLVLSIPVILLVAIGNRILFPPMEVTSPNSKPPRVMPQKETYRSSKLQRTNPSKVGVDFQVDDAFKRTRTYVPRVSIADTDPAAFAKSLYEDSFRPDAMQQL